jgi:hypothetical protein
VKARVRARSLPFAVVLLLASVVPANSEDAATRSTTPLRTLTYDVAYSLQTYQDTHVSGLTGGQPHAMETGRAAVQRGFVSNDRGTLQIEVVAAPADGTLVVDATYTGREAKQPAVRVVIFPDGTLSYDPQRQLAAQARQLLPLLARGLLAERDVSPGSSWTTPISKPAQGATTYRVTKRDDTRATIVVAADITVAGPDGFEEHDDGTATYALDVLCPVSYDVRRRLRRQITPERLESTDSRVTATLVSDSFAKKL